MVIVVTDEVGDDEARLEDAVALAQRAKVPVYVLGRKPSLAETRATSTTSTPRPSTSFAELPVQQGPESVTLEQIRLPFWYGGLQYDIVEAGFGPYALSRLASATGGIYFVTRFDSAAWVLTRPGCASTSLTGTARVDYEKRSPPRRCAAPCLDAALITQQKLPGMPSVSFPPADAPEFKDVMAVNQGIAERTAYTVDEALVSDQRRGQAPRP